MVITARCSIPFQGARYWVAVPHIMPGAILPFELNPWIRRQTKRLHSPAGFLASQTLVQERRKWKQRGSQGRVRLRLSPQLLACLRTVRGLTRTSRLLEPLTSFFSHPWTPAAIHPPSWQATFIWMTSNSLWFRSRQVGRSPSWRALRFFVLTAVGERLEQRG